MRYSTRRFVHAFGIFTLAVALLSGCGASTAPSIPLTVDLVSTDTIMRPDMFVRGVVSVTAPAGVRIDSVNMSASGVVHTSVTFVVGETGPFTGNEQYYVAPDAAPGQLILAATAHAGSVSASDTLAITISDSATARLLGGH